MNELEPPWNVWQVKFRREWICLKCSRLFNEPKPRCPKCGGPLCVRIIKIKG